MAKKLNTTSAMKRAASLGAAGFAVGGLPGAAIGAGVGAIAGLFEKDPDEILRERRDAMIKNINAERTKRIANIERTTSNQRMTDQQGAGYRAIAAGRDPQNAEDSYLVANQRSAENQNRALENTNQAFDAQINQVNAEYEGRPIQPSLGDVLLESGMSVAGTMQQEELMQLRKDYLDAYAKNANAKVTDGLPKASSETVVPDLSMQAPIVDPGPMPQIEDTQVFAPKTFVPEPSSQNVVQQQAPVQQQTQAVAKAYSPNSFVAPVIKNPLMEDQKTSYDFARRSAKSMSANRFARTF